ncbi:hypothetical protein DPMN_013725 [Dreissena polymorpha]|uniref:Uncharacterized protein n=1 Tax=Dreissena polymorpha TaxID=45954 RepID=A0A9D4S227_DREPO|nr:hypothetical protein DPMN_013725 [Dreissena polymorpha]
MEYFTRSVDKKTATCNVCKLSFTYARYKHGAHTKTVFDNYVLHCFALGIRVYNWFKIPDRCNRATFDCTCPYHRKHG